MMTRQSLSIFALLVFFVVLIQASYAVDYIAHDIDVLIPPFGTPVVNEVYQIKLNTTEKAKFTSDFSGNVSLEKLISWGTGPSFKVDIPKYHVSYVLGDSGFAQVNLQYTSDEILHKLKDLGNTEIVSIEGKDMVFYNNGKFVLPMKPATQLTIQFPKGYRLADTPQPTPSEQRVLANIPGYLGEFYEYMWRGPLSSTNFRLSFIRTKDMQKPFTLEGIMDDLKYRFGNPLYAVATLIILVLVFIYRKQIMDLIREVFAEEPYTAEEED